MKKMSLPPEIRPSFYFANPYFSTIFEPDVPVWGALGRIQEVLHGLGANSEGSVIDQTAKVHTTAIVKNSLICSDCFIGEFAVVRDSLIGPNCIVGHCSEVARSIIMSHSAITHFCFIGDSIIGQKVLIGGGVRTANRRLDKSCITIRVLGQEIPTDRSFLGVIAGDGCRVGGGVHPNPGTLIGQEVYVMPGIDLRGFIPSLSFVKAKWIYEIVPRSEQDAELTVESITDQDDTYDKAG